MAEKLSAGFSGPLGWSGECLVGAIVWSEALELELAARSSWKPFAGIETLLPKHRPLAGEVSHEALVVSNGATIHRAVLLMSRTQVNPQKGCSPNTDPFGLLLDLDTGHRRRCKVPLALHTMMTWQ
jgi:hypothetical protein